MFRTPQSRHEAAALTTALQMTDDPDVATALEEAIEEWKYAGEPLSDAERAQSLANWGPPPVECGDDTDSADAAPEIVTRSQRA